MAETMATLTLTRVRATAYRADDGQDFLVQLRAQLEDGRTIDGMGVSRPRGTRTGDKATISWELLTECLRHLEHRRLAVGGPTLTVSSLASTLDELRLLAAHRKRQADEERRADDAGRSTSRRPTAVFKRLVKQTLGTTADAVLFWRKPRPFEGTLLGVEAALLDLGSRATDIAPATLAGRRWRSVRSHLPQPLGQPDRTSDQFAQVLRQVIDCVSFPPSPPPTHRGRPSTSYDEVPYLKPLGSNGTKGHLLEREALVLGLNTVRYSKGAFIATDNIHPPLIFKWSRSPRSSAVSLALCTHKEATRLRLRQHGVPVPHGRTFAYGDFTSARAFVARTGYPVVVKPAMGVRGIGVVANIHNDQELESAFTQLVDSRLGKDDFIVEQHITGRDYRIVVVGDEVIAAIQREPASVEGDGVHNIAELMINKNVFRRLNPHLWGRPIKYGTAARYQLERAGLTLTSVPAPGQQVLLSNTCSLSQGGDSIDVLDELHPSIKDACIRAVKAVPGLWFCGIDFLLEDHTRPLSTQQAGICELNAHAAIGNCEYPLYGTPRQVARTVFAQCVDRYGLVVNEKPADHLALRLTVRGDVTGVGYRAWLRRHARTFGVTGWVRNIGANAVEAVLVGDAVPVSALTAAAVLGPRRARPSSVTTEHIPAPTATGFEILEDRPEEGRHGL